MAASNSFSTNSTSKTQSRILEAINMNKILCIGEALIDMICTNKGSSLADGKDFIKKPGGAPTNVAAAIAALGGNVSLAAKVGKDPFGKYLLEVLNGFNVDTSHMVQDPDHFTTLAFVSLMENGERDFYFNRGADGMLSTADTALINMDEFNIVHFGSATGFLPGPLNGAYNDLLKRALDEKVYISFDPNYRQLLFGNDQETFIQRSWEFIERCNFFKVSDEEALLLSQEASIEAAAEVFFKRSQAVFAITLGKEGTLLGYENTSFLVPSIAIEQVDTTGAGDAFAGAVLFQLSQFSTKEMTMLDAAAWKNIFSYANKAGARTCEYMGAMEAFKHLSSGMFST